MKTWTEFRAEKKENLWAKKRVVSMQPKGSNGIDIHPFLGCELLPKQKLFLSAWQQYIAYIGGVGSGKTSVGCWAINLLGLEFPGNELLVCRSTYRKLKDSTRHAFFEMLAAITFLITGRAGDVLEPKTCPLVLDFSKTDNDLIIYTGRGNRPSIIRFRSLDNYENLLSTQFGSALIDEATDQAFTEEIFRAIDGRLRHPAQKGKHKLFLTTNPCNKSHWIYKRFVRDKDPNYVCFNAPTSENHYLPEGYEERLRKNFPKVYAQRYLDGEFGVSLDGEPVFPNFTEERHVGRFKYNPALGPIHRGWDFGRRHPACLLTQIKANRIYVLKELQGEDMLIKSFAEDVLQHCEEFYPNAQYKDFGDVAGNQKGDKSEKTSIEILRLLKINTVCTKVFIKPEIEKILVLLEDGEDKFPRILVDAGCEIFISAMSGGYHYETDPNKSDSDVLPKKDNVHDHFVDCFRYIIGNNAGFNIWWKQLFARKSDYKSFRWHQKLAKGGKGYGGRVL